MRTAVYLRISQDRDQDERGITRQREDAERLVTQRGWSIEAVYSENDTSAAGKARRPQFDAMLRAVEGGQIEAIVAWSLDRLVRNARDRLRLVEACQKHRVVIALVRGSDMDPTTPAGRLAIGILGEVAQHEIEVKADRQRRAAQQAAENGKPAPGPLPFGFLPDRLTHDPARADAIRDAYAAVLSGASLAGIAREWNAAGLTSGRVRTSRVRTGKPSTWRAETIRALLLNPRNAGLRALNGTIIGTAMWEPIVDQEAYYAVSAMLRDPSRRMAPPTPRHLLSGVAVCGTCGEPVVAGTTRPRYFAYRCRSNGHVARRGDHVDGWIAGGVIEGEQVRGLAVERLSQPDAIELIPTREHGPDVADLRSRAQALRARIDDLAVAFADGDLTRAQFRANRDRKLAELAAVEAELAEAGQMNVLAPLVTADDVAAVWHGLSVDRQRVVIDVLMTVTLHPVGQGRRRFDPATVQIEWKA